MLYKVYIEYIVDGFSYGAKAIVYAGNKSDAFNKTIKTFKEYIQGSKIDYNIRSLYIMY